MSLIKAKVKEKLGVELEVMLAMYISRNGIKYPFLVLTVSKTFDHLLMLTILAISGGSHQR